MIYRRGSVQRIVQGHQQTYLGDQVVVELAHAELVLRQLESWGAAPRVVDEDERLGLALVTLEASHAVRRLRKQFLSWVNDAVARAEDAGLEASDLDLTVACLRRVFARRYAGWVPQLGKNRLLERVTTTSVRPWPSDPDGAAEPLPAAVLRSRFPGDGARVGVIDTTLRAHPWLQGGVIAAARDLAPVGAAGHRGDADHATFVAGLVLRQAPGAVVDLRAGVDDDGTADCWSVAKDMADLADRGADVVLLGLGCRTDDGREPMVLAQAVRAVSGRAVIVSAAGDHAGSAESAEGAAPIWPAASGQVVAVGALDGQSAAAFSVDPPWVDALAPGVQLASTCDIHRDGSGGFGHWSGTAFAAAVVSGAIAAHAGNGRAPHAAWREVAQGSKRDERGRPVVSLRRASTWPPDGSA